MEKMTIVFASFNPKKVEELKNMVPECINLVCLSDIPEAQNIPQAEENGTTFQQNSKIKAKYWAKKLNMPVLAEDSGLEIEALNGYPGVYTKRCIQDLCPGANIDEDNPSELYPLLLKLIAESGKNTTKAKWTSSMTFVDGNFSISSPGKYLEGDMCPCTGTRVFGFDQYFKPIGLEKTLSQMEPKEKESISPRKEEFESIMNLIPYF